MRRPEKSLLYDWLYNYFKFRIAFFFVKKVNQHSILTGWYYMNLFSVLLLLFFVVHTARAGPNYSNILILVRKISIQSLNQYSELRFFFLSRT
jgi:hypothetical protein